MTAGRYETSARFARLASSHGFETVFDIAASFRRRLGGRKPLQRSACRHPCRGFAQSTRWRTSVLLTTTVAKPCAMTLTGDLAEVLRGIMADTSHSLSLSQLNRAPACNILQPCLPSARDRRRHGIGLVKPGQWKDREHREKDEENDCRHCRNTMHDINRPQSITTDYTRTKQKE